MPTPFAPNPQQTFLQQGNKQVLLSWNIVPGATISYRVYRNTTGIIPTGGISDPSLIATVTDNKYLDTSVTQNIQYWYWVSTVQTVTLPTPGTYESGLTSPTPASIIPVIAGYMSLQQLRTLAQQKSDRVNSNFVTLPEWNSFINLAADELYDLITTVYEDYQVEGPVFFTTNGSQQSYPLPDGITVFQDKQGNNIVPPPLYKLAGVDLGLNNAPNGFVTIQKYNLIDRNRYVFPNTASTIYGVFGMQYRVIGNTIRFIPTPSSLQPIGLWYVPRRRQLVLETDTTDGYNGWTNYIIARAAKYALDKEESDSSKLDAEIIYLKQRIEESAPNRDEGQADTVSDGRMASGFGPDGGGGWQGPFGTGW